jgi:hypothetical protein
MAAPLKLTMKNEPQRTRRAQRNTKQVKFKPRITRMGTDKSGLPGGTGFQPVLAMFCIGKI